MIELINSGALVYEYTDSGAINKIIVDVKTSLPDDFLVTLMQNFFFNV